MASRKPYEGVLRKRMLGKEPGEITERMAALFDHYGIKPSDVGAGLRLALALAGDWVPGFKLAHRKGRPPYRTSNDIIILLDCYRADKSGQSVSAAARLLADTGVIKGLDGEQIRQRYLRMKRKGLSRDVIRVMAVISAGNRKFC